MIFQSKVKVAVLVWLACEAAIAAVAVKLLGWPVALLASLIATIFGFYLVAKSGRAAIAALDQSIREPGRLEPDRLSNGVLRALSGVLLVIPGFASDLVGLALLFGKVRNLLLQRFFAARGRARTRDIDLSPDEWKSE